MELTHERREAFDLTDGQHRGFLVSISVQEPVASRLAVAGGEPPSAMHITLCYAKVAADFSTEEIADLVAAERYVAARTKPFTWSVTGSNRFPATEHSDNMDVLFAEVESSDLLAFRSKVYDALTDAGAEPNHDFEYTPHITLQYIAPESELTPLVAPIPGVPVTSVTVSKDGMLKEIPLGTQFEVEFAAVTALQRLPRVTAGAGTPEMVRTTSLFKKPKSELVLPLNRKTTQNFVASVLLMGVEPTQELVPITGLTKYISKPRRDPADVARVQMNGTTRWILQEGHTRVAAALLRGETAIDMRVWEFEQDAAGRFVPTPRGLHRRGLVMMSYRDRLVLEIEPTEDDDRWLYDLAFDRLFLEEFDLDDAGAGGGCGAHTAGWRERCGVDSQGRLVGASGRPLSEATIRSRDNRANPNHPAAQRAARAAAERAARAESAIAAVEAEAPPPVSEGGKDLGRQDLQIRSDAQASLRMKDLGFKNARDAARALVSGVHFDQGETSLIARYDNELRVEIRLSKGGNSIGSDRDEYGTLRVSLEINDNKAYVGLVNASEGYRSGGDTMKVLSNLATLGEKIGLDSVSASANLDMGGFAWARMGFEASDPESVARTVEARLDRLQDPNPTPRAYQTYQKVEDDAREAMSRFTPKQFDELRSVIRENKANPKLPAMLSEASVDGKKIGRHLLRGTSWYAKLNLKDPEAVARFKRFAR